MFLLLEHLRKNLAQISGFLDGVHRNFLLSAQIGEIAVSVAVFTDNHEVGVAGKGNERRGVGTATVRTADVHAQNVNVVFFGCSNQVFAAGKLRGNVKSCSAKSLAAAAEDNDQGLVLGPVNILGKNCHFVVNLILFRHQLHRIGVLALSEGSQKCRLPKGGKRSLVSSKCSRTESKN